MALSPGPPLAPHAVLDPTNTASQVWATLHVVEGQHRHFERRGLSAELQRPKPRGRPMPTHIRRANAARATVRSAVEHVFAAQKRRTPRLPEPAEKKQIEAPKRQIENRHTGLDTDDIPF